MIRTFYIALLVLAFPCAAMAIDVTVEGVGKDGEINKRFAKCIATIDGKSTNGENVRPTVSWSGGPKEAKSYAIIVSDPDVPADLRIANKADMKITKKDDRQTLYHWVQFDIPANVTSIPGGRTLGFGTAASNTVSKSQRYDGPCPPWNDEKLHHYHFKVVALNVRKLGSEAGVAAEDAIEAINAHSIEEGEKVGTFTLNPDMREGL